ncbi:MAG: histidine phosphatase family protein [Cytophagaceae bacterium]|nr:histidine phosphatase family protein [Gemmatimonadaceae bacterium]
MLHLLSTFGLAAGLATADIDSTELRREALMSALQRGGYTILLRHARTDRTVQENPGYIPAKRTDQRNLNDDGVRDARLMGVVFKKFRIPVGEILSSPMFRTRETAEYAVGAPTDAMPLRSFPPTPEQAALVAIAPTAGTNRVLVTHHFVIEKHVPGIKPGDVGESEAAVVRPTSEGKVELVGRITLADWQALAAEAPKTAEATHAMPAGHGAPKPSTPVVVPDTPAGRLAKAYVRAFNTGDVGQMRTFIETFLVANANRSTDERVQTFTKTFTDFGPLSVTEIHASEGNEVTLGVATKQGPFRLTVKASPDQAGRAASITLAGTQGGHS